MSTEQRTISLIPGREKMVNLSTVSSVGSVVFMEPTTKPAKRKALDILDWISSSLQKGKILDAGCGPSHLEHWASMLKPDLKVFGIDLSTVFLKKSREGGNARLVNGDISRAFPFRSSAFDGVLFSDTLEHIYPEEAVLAMQEAHRVLKPRGWIFINIPNRISWSKNSHRIPGHLWLPTKEEMAEMLKAQGFNNDGMEVITRGFPGSNLAHTFLGRDLRLPYLGRSIFIKAHR